MNKLGSTVTAVIGAAVGTALVATAGSAAAAISAFQDIRGDMAHGADIHSVKVVNEKNVRVVLKVADLVPSYKSGAGVTVYLDTDPSDAGPEFAFLGGMFEGTDYALVRTEGWDVPDNPRVVRDFHIMKLDYENDVARFRMTRAALDDPGKVRVEVKTSGEQNDGDIVRDWLQDRREFTSWVKRG
ncbi:MAG: hypothetical protein ACLGH4_09850 [Actinomycetes bacterium]